MARIRKIVKLLITELDDNSKQYNCGACGEDISRVIKRNLEKIKLKLVFGKVGDIKIGCWRCKSRINWRRVGVKQEMLVLISEQQARARA